MRTIKCMIIDDDQEDRELFEIALERLKIPYTLMEAANGIIGREMLESGLIQLPDYIFLDLNMPLLNGKEFLSLARQTPLLQDIPIIIYSTSSYYKDIETTQNLGATHFVSKMPNLERLAMVLSNIFQKKELPYYLN